MMPVAGQDAVLDAAPIERETHMRATIVEREDAAALVDDEDRAMAAVDDKPPFMLSSASVHARTNSAFTMTPPLPTSGSTS